MIEKFLKRQKGAVKTHDAFNVSNKFVEDRAGFEPATNELKVPVAPDVTVSVPPFYSVARGMSVHC
jgi:hypothetical protein